MRKDELKGAPFKKVVFSVISIGGSKTEGNDESGKAVMDTMKAHGHRIESYSIVKDGASGIQKALRIAMEDFDIQAIILIGGVGISKTDDTIEAIDDFVEKEIPGFGELFRAMSYDEIGPSAMPARAVAFLSERKIVFALPDYVAMVRLVAEKLIAHEVGNLVAEANR